MLRIDKNIEVIGIEAQAQSRIILAKVGDTSKCLQIVTDERPLVVQDQLEDTQKVIKFNAFDEITDDQVKENTKLLLEQSLSTETIEKINKLFN